MIKYYNCRYTSILVFYPGNKVSLDFSDIYITCPFIKLPHCHLRPYMVEKQVELILYYLKLSQALQKLYLVFPVVKLITVLTNFISRRFSSLSLNLIIIDGEECYKMRKCKQTSVRYIQIVVLLLVYSEREGT